MSDIWIIILTGICSVLASSGFWAYITSKKQYTDASSLMLKGLGHDRIIELCLKYIERGSISQDEYENLYNYLYVPYEKMHGNGSAKRLMNVVNTLPVTKN